MIDSANRDLIVALVTTDRDQAVAVVNALAGRGMTVRQLTVTIWIAAIGFAIDRSDWRLALLAAGLPLFFAVLDIHYSWLYVQIQSSVTALERTLVYYVRTLRRPDDADVASDLDTELDLFSRHLSSTPALDPSIAAVRLAAMANADLVPDPYRRRSRYLHSGTMTRRRCGEGNPRPGGGEAGMVVEAAGRGRRWTHERSLPGRPCHTAPDQQGRRPRLVLATRPAALSSRPAGRTPGLRRSSVRRAAGNDGATGAACQAHNPFGSPTPPHASTRLVLAAPISRPRQEYDRVVGKESPMAPTRPLPTMRSCRCVGDQHDLPSSGPYDLPGSGHHRLPRPSVRAVAGTLGSALHPKHPIADAAGRHY